VRAVFDPNVLVSALVSRGGVPAQLVARWIDGDFELIVSEAVLAELERALGYPKLRSRVNDVRARRLMQLLRSSATFASDVPDPAPRSEDPGDDYLFALAERERAVVVSGDRHVLSLAARFPVRSPREFLDSL
jgi:putative PIN family toxin of toxin-antitoxin system